MAPLLPTPSSLRIRKRNRPIAADFMQFKPGLSFIGRPGRRPRSEIWLGLGRDHNCAISAVAVFFFNMTASVALRVAQAENGSLHRRLFNSCQVLPPSCEVAISALSFDDRSTPPTMPFRESRKADEISESQPSRPGFRSSRMSRPTPVSTVSQPYCSPHLYRRCYSAAGIAIFK